MKHYEYYDGLIQVWDEFLPVGIFQSLAEDVSRLPYYWGEIDDIDTPPAGLVSNLSEGSDIVTLMRNNIEPIVSLGEAKFIRSYVNFFAPNEKAYYHTDDVDHTFLLYLNSKWDVNEGGETKFLIQDGNYPVVFGIAPIPNRLVMFNGYIKHTATSFKSDGRFTLALKYDNKENK